MDSPELTKDIIVETLSNFYVSVTISKHEHIAVLKKKGLESDMPSNWNRVDPYARYKYAGIEIIENQ